MYVYMYDYMHIAIYLVHLISPVLYVSARPPLTAAASVVTYLYSTYFYLPTLYYHM